jgi:hypothetical protein
MSSSQAIRIFVWLRLEFGWASNTKVMEDFLCFLTVMNPSSYGRQIESYDLYKLRCVAESHLWIEQDNRTIWNLSLLPKENWKNLEYRDHRTFHNLPNEGLNSRFEF